VLFVFTQLAVNPHLWQIEGGGYLGDLSRLISSIVQIRFVSYPAFPSTLPSSLHSFVLTIYVP